MSEVLELTKKLVSVPSLAENPDELRRVLAVADEFLPEGLTRHRYERESKPSLVVGFSDTKHPRVLILGHLDVVDAKPEQFTPVLDGDRLLGRGVIDMKGPAAAVMVAVREAWEAGRRPDVALMLTTDEEVGSPNGVAYLVREEGWGADFVVIPDGGFNFTLTIKGKGAFHFRIFASGVAAHGSATWAGVNAIDKLLAFYDDLKPFFQLSSDDPAHWHETLNLGVIKGGKKVNIIPDEAEGHFDIRFTEAWTLSRVRDRVKELAAKHGVELEIWSEGEPFFTDPNNPYLREFAACVARVLGHEPALGHEHGATDGRFFSEKGTPTVIMYPEGGNLHADGEWVSVSSLLKLKEIMSQYLEGL